MSAALAQLARALKRAAHPPPWATASERIARAAIGMPAFHPERLTGRVGRREVGHLGAWSQQCWPAGEYTAIIRDTRLEDS
jgi:hypothetical protein